MSKRRIKPRLKDGRVNLRGQYVRVHVVNKWVLATVITHIRGDKWLVESDNLPEEFARWGGLVRRTTVTESEMRLL